MKCVVITKTSLDYLKKHNKTKDSINKLEIEKALERQRASFEFEYREKELLFQQSQMELEFERKSSRQKVVLYATIALSLFLFTIILFVSNNIRIRRKAYQKLELANKEIENVANKLRESNRMKDKLFSIIGHDLRNPIQTLKGYIELMQYGELSSEDFKSASNEFAKNINNTLILFESLLTWAKAQIGDQNKNLLEKIEVSEIITRNIELISDVAQKKNIQLISCCTENIEAYADSNTVDLITRNLLGNAIKFTQIGGRVMVTCEDTDDKIWIHIADSGIGMTKEQIDAIGKKSLSTQGTSKEQGTGLGLMFGVDFIEKNGGELKIKSKKGEGSTFSFSLSKYHNTL